ncbi:IS21 family transposase [Bacillus sp. BRMEA1]|uniref:IS21 family transposase n=1 Tax=Neobacillus endophyticus TaxID=2738405 RepID=UPI001566EEF3|nr:IS21 family transposase [Neobacillus endophyticus]NRD80206.1 IS21 family transposase [Neobacillus endophyticus]
MDKWLMYMEIHQLRKKGFSISKIARKLDIARNTVYTYLQRDPEDMTEWLASIRTRSRKLDPHKELILTWLKDHQDMSAAQVFDWLKEKDNRLMVGESTVRGYVKELREIYHIERTHPTRSYQAVQDPPMGEQAQIDFGQTKQKASNGKEVKLYFISFVLSNSRYKYMEWLDRPFTTRDVIRTHENAFEYFGGIPNELVYDQDSLIVVSENSGDLILTSEFQGYRQERDLNLRVCRKADPESKGKIENTVKFIKKNFAKHRVFHNLDQWNEQCLEWLDRTRNGKIHNTTKKRPAEVFIEEKQHLRPITNKKTFHNKMSITRTVRKDNTILYQSNRYSVPLGTYKKDKMVYLIITDDGRLVIHDKAERNVIADHRLETGKGKLVQDRNHTRDRSRGIPEYISHLAAKFNNPDQANDYLENIYHGYPRYIRDQLQLIRRTIEELDEDLMNQAMEECIKKKLYSANDFSDVVEYLKRQRLLNTNPKPPSPAVHPIKSLNDADESILLAKPSVRDPKEYEELFKGVVI